MNGKRKYLRLHNMFLPIVICMLTAQLSGNDTSLVFLNGTPSEIGNKWGTINRQSIINDMDLYFIKKSAEKGITKDQLIKQSKKFVSIAREVAPHWLDEARSISQAADVDPELYVAFIGNVYRGLFMHECTSYSVSRDYTEGNAILFHKNRDNVEKDQSAFIMNSAIPGVNKFIAVSDASVICCMMMVNEKGLAGSADYPGGLQPEPDVKQYRGIMNTFLLRHIAERASDCSEALNIIKDFVNKGYYAGGDVDATHWLFVDRNGTIMEISNNAGKVVSLQHSSKTYFSRLQDSKAASLLREASDPIDFALFHSVSRDPSICFSSSISGMTVEIDPFLPEVLTCAWITLPAHSAAFPLMMGGSGTPLPLLNGKAYQLAKEHRGYNELWESTEGSLHLSKTMLRETIPEVKMTDSEQKHIGDIIDNWTKRQSALILNILQIFNK